MLSPLHTSSREAGGIAADGVVYKGVDVQLLPRPDLGLDGIRIGELAVLSPRLIGGYFRDSERTAEAFVQVSENDGGGVFLFSLKNYRLLYCPPFADQWQGVLPHRRCRGSDAATRWLNTRGVARPLWCSHQTLAGAYT
jgi:hypothetical protein